MAAFSPAIASAFVRLHNPNHLQTSTDHLFTPLRFLASPNSAVSSLRLRRFTSLFCSSASPPPPPDNPVESVQVVLSRVTNKVRIFFAVLFWMSLFFWGSAWDKGDDYPRKKKNNPWLKK